MKPVLISIQRPHTDNIKALLKRIEVRKDKPKQKTPFPCYIYETKAKGGCGKVIGEFVCDKVDKYTFSYYEGEYRVNHLEQEAMCLNHPELIRYGVGRTLYGWHISDLKIYDKPKELSEFKTPPCEKSERACGNCKWLVKINTPDVYECECYVEDGRPITRSPRSWRYVEEL